MNYKLWRLNSVISRLGGMQFVAGGMFLARFLLGRDSSMLFILAVRLWQEIMVLSQGMFNLWDEAAYLGFFLAGSEIE